MGLRKLIHRAALRLERLIDRLRPARATETPVLEAYRGYATPATLVLRGRVLTRMRRGAPEPDQSRWVNFKQMVALFLTSEVAGVAVQAVRSGVATVSDEEGYVTLDVPRLSRGPGWIEVAASVAGADEPALFPVLVPHPDATFGVISDIDDTLMRTGAYSLARNLWTTFTGSAITREVFEDSVALMQRLTADGKTPVFYVSSSPWNLHGFLERIFARAGLPRGPIFLRDLGLAEDQFVTRGHGHHKGGAIDRILAANPSLDFVLLGDTGQKDAHIYLAAAERHPGRIRAVWLREPGPGPDAASRQALDRLRAIGIEARSMPDFTAAAEGWPLR